MRRAVKRELGRFLPCGLISEIEFEKNGFCPYSFTHFLKKSCVFGLCADIHGAEIGAEPSNS